MRRLTLLEAKDWRGVHARLVDRRLVAKIRAGDERAFEALYERYRGPLLSFCRSMLGCPEAAQDATQQVFANAYRDLKQSDKELDVKPWLYAIARNHCISILRSRRPDPVEVEDLSHAPGVDRTAEGREGFQDLLRDVRELSDRQRAAVMMATLGGFSHREIAAAIGCETEQVKAILFQARTALSERAEAREVSCSEIREQLRVLRGGSLRRNRIRLHLEACEGCRSYRESVRRERLTTSGAIAVAPLAWLTGLAKSLLGKLSVAGAGLREQGVAPLAAVAFATGAGVVGVATVAEAIKANPDSPAALQPAPTTEPTQATRRVATQGPQEPVALAGSGSEVPVSDLLLGLLSGESLDISALLGANGLLDLSEVLNVTGASARGLLGDLGQAAGGTGSSGGSSGGAPSSHGPSSNGGGQQGGSGGQGSAGGLGLGPNGGGKGR